MAFHLNMLVTKKQINIQLQRFAAAAGPPEDNLYDVSASRTHRRLEYPISGESRHTGAAAAIRETACLCCEK